MPSPRGAAFRALVACAVTVLAAAPLTAASAEDEDSAVGHVYVLNNNLGSTNSITVFGRAANGALHLQGVTPIGGTGSLLAFADGTEGSIIRTPDRERLFRSEEHTSELQSHSF